tara:strand:- start:433 stop:690 length:258 start_codon:yes stop_codon:yes gene_type:complete
MLSKRASSEISGTTVVAVEAAERVDASDTTGAGGGVAAAAAFLPDAFLGAAEVFPEFFWEFFGVVAFLALAVALAVEDDFLEGMV